MPPPSRAGPQPRPTVGDEVQGQALEGLIAGDEVVAHRVDDQAQELVLLHRGRRRAGSDQGRSIRLLLRGAQAYSGGQWQQEACRGAAAAQVRLCHALVCASCRPAAHRRQQEGAELWKTRTGIPGGKADLCKRTSLRNTEQAT